MRYRRSALPLGSFNLRMRRLFLTPMPAIVLAISLITAPAPQLTIHDTHLKTHNREPRTQDSQLRTPSNLLLSRNRTEPVVAVDPGRSSTIVAGSNTNYDQPVGDSYPDASYASHNGGRSFTFGTLPIVRPYTTQADPGAVIDGNGTLFFSYLAETPAYCSSGSSAVLLTHSIDGGRSFRPARLVDTNSADDKPNLAVETIRRHPSHVFLTWTRWHGGSDIWFSRSLDGGVTFSAPLMLHTAKLDNYGSVPVVGPRHHVYVFWSRFPDLALSKTFPAQIVMRASTDDGAHFGKLRVIEQFTGIPQMADPGSLRSLTMPAVVVDPHGRLYLAWPQVRRVHSGGSLDVDIMIARSSPGGSHWAPPRRVNNSRRGDRFMPSIALMADGSVDVAFYDRRNGSGELDLYAAAISFKQGFHRSPNIRVNRHSSPVSDISYIRPGSTCLAPGRFFGDYIGTAAEDNQLCVVWADTQLHVPNETDIWFSKVRLPNAGP